MTFVQRLLLMIGVAISSLVVVGATNHVEMGRVYEAANFGSTMVVPSVETLSKVSTEFGRLRVRTYRYLLFREDAKALEKVEAQIAESRVNIAKTLKAYESLVADAEDGRLLAAQRAAFDEYNKSVDKVMALARSGKEAEAREELHRAAPTAVKFIEQLDAHMKYNEDLGSKASAEAASAKTNATWVTAGILLAAIAAILLTGVTIARTLTSRLAQANAVAARIAGGDLTAAADGAQDRKDEVGQLLRSLEAMRVDLARTIGQIMGGADQVVASATELSTASRQVSASTETQSSSTAAAAAAVEELTVSIDHVGNGADDASRLAATAGTLAEDSGRGVAEATTHIGRVAERVAHTASQMQTLSDQVQQIGKITTVIREVADQTNLLALNAAIEAARAGDQGRGFAVVADEVRKLAERTTASVREISMVIDTIQQGAVAAVDSMTASRDVVDLVVVSAGKASESMTSIRGSADTMKSSIDSISDALREQRTASNALASNVEAIAQMSEKNAAAVSTLASTAAQLQGVSDGLRGTVERFRL